MISVTHFVSDDADFADRARAALDALAVRPGYLGGSVGRSTDDPSAWLLVTEWRNVGSYRRALGSYDVKLCATPLLGQAVDQPSSFEQLLQIGADGSVVTHHSDLALPGLPGPRVMDPSAE